jgi:hypothetical protein
MGDEAIEELEPLEEWPLEKMEWVGEDGVTEGGDLVVGAGALGGFTVRCSILQVKVVGRYCCWVVP